MVTVMVTGMILTEPQVMQRVIVKKDTTKEVIAIKVMERNIRNRIIINN